MKSARDRLEDFLTGSGPRLSLHADMLSLVDEVELDAFLRAHNYVVAAMRCAPAPPAMTTELVVADVDGRRALAVPVAWLDEYFAVPRHGRWAIYLSIAMWIR